MGEAIKVKEKIYLGQHLRKFGAVYAFIILVIVDSMLNKNFLALNTLWNLSIQVLPILLTALGMLLVISTSGLPTAISKMVSERVTLGDYRGAHRADHAGRGQHFAGDAGGPAGCYTAGRTERRTNRAIQNTAYYRYAGAVYCRPRRCTVDEQWHDLGVL